MKKEIIEFHIKNGYFIKVQRTKTANGCFVEYPKYILKNYIIEPFIACYLCEDNKIKYYTEKEGEDGDNKEMSVPNYAIRSVIAEDILMQTIYLNLSHELIFCYNKEGNPCENIHDIPQLINPPQDSLDKTKEQALMDILKYVIQGLDYSQQAQELDVYEGYKIIKKVFDNKGVCNV